MITKTNLKSALKIKNEVQKKKNVYNIKFKFA